MTQVPTNFPMKQLHMISFKTTVNKHIQTLHTLI